jgi:hypothetical protein
MIGAMIPDLNRLLLIPPKSTVEDTLVLPFSWGAFHTLS